MNRSKLLTVLFTGALVAACDSGDITLAPTNIDNSNQGNTTSNPPPVADNPCASYEESGQTFEGTVNTDGNCVYDTSFVSDTRPITVSTIRFPNFGGLHIFEDSLFIGEDVDANAASTGRRIPQEGEGTRLIIDAGNTMVFQAADSYVRIARGSQIFAEGTASDPITFTADEDAIQGIATESDRGLWGGMQINGNGRTNKCHDGTITGNNGVAGGSQFEPTANNVHGCHATAEGRPATYGGNNNAENSGVLTYVVIKHAGFEVVDGDELNALTLNGVGSGTTISHVQTYTSLDDGFEMFGGAVNMDHIVAVNVGDDSIDYSEGYNGLIQYAVVVHTSGGNRCIEGDNTGGGRGDGITPTTKLWISNMTCITSNVSEGAGNNPSSKGSSEGPLFREGTFFEMFNSIVTSNEATMTSNECIELADSEGPETIDAAQDGTSIMASNVIACSEFIKSSPGSFANTGFEEAELETLLTSGANTNNIFDGTNIPYTSLIVGGVGTRGYLTAATITDSASTVVFDQSTDLADLNDDTLYPVPASTGFFETATYLGGANEGDDWLAGWTVGLSAPLDP
ncbi:MAG: hypothetical protein QNJ05_03830 [Woeseiaceae bacterium]|nr:hypothetical protein [Woeseiaceae bacterium]